MTERRSTPRSLLLAQKNLEMGEAELGRIREVSEEEAVFIYQPDAG
jgi:hypothetical protein